MPNDDDAAQQSVEGTFADTRPVTLSRTDDGWEWPEEEFPAYMRVRWPSLVRSAVLLGCSPHDAEDLAQTVLARCFVSWAKVAQADDRDAYVYRVLVNAHTDSRRRHWWKERPSAEPPECEVTDDATGPVDISDAVERALGGLSQAHRAVVVLRFYAGLSEEQTATTLGVPVVTIKSRTSRGLKQLARSKHLADLQNWSSS